MRAHGHRPSGDPPPWSSDARTCAAHCPAHACNDQVTGPVTEPRGPRRPAREECRWRTEPVPAGAGAHRRHALLPAGRDAGRDRRAPGHVPRHRQPPAARGARAGPGPHRGAPAARRGPGRPGRPAAHAPWACRRCRCRPSTAAAHVGRGRLPRHRQAPGGSGPRTRGRAAGLLGPHRLRDRPARTAAAAGRRRRPDDRRAGRTGGLVPDQRDHPADRRRRRRDPASSSHAPAFPGRRCTAASSRTRSSSGSRRCGSDARCALMGVGAPPLQRDSIPGFVPTEQAPLADGRRRRRLAASTTPRARRSPTRGPTVSSRSRWRCCTACRSASPSPTAP